MKKIAAPSNEALAKARNIAKSLAWDHPFKDDVERVRSFLHGQASLAQQGKVSWTPPRCKK